MDSHHTTRGWILGQLTRRLVKVILTMLVIVWLTQFGLILAERGRQGLPAQPWEAAFQAVSHTVNYLLAHPSQYYWRKADYSALELVMTTFSRSAGLLLVSLSIAVLLGSLLGIWLGLRRKSQRTVFPTLLSVLGVSTPSFMLAMLLWVVAIQISRWRGEAILPLNGFGWDQHLILPAIVLAMRPLAQIARLTHLTINQVLDTDYIRMAQAKGLPRLTILQRHILPNAAIPVLTTAGASLRYSLASLPVVEYFFAWPGVGLTLLEAIRAGEASLVTDLILSLGAFFLLLNLLLEMIFPRLDPRLRSNEESQSTQDALSAREIIAGWVTALKDLAGGMMKSLIDLLHLLGRRHQQQTDRGVLSDPVAPHPGPARGKRNNTHATYRGENPAMTAHAQRSNPGMRNPALWLGIILALLLVSIVVFGNRLSPGNPYEIHGIMKIDDQINAPPFRPSPPFPWGSDQIGRDVQALVLWGARQTLTLALFGMLARLLVGTMLGLIAGWQSGSRLDRLITGAIDVWAAFPAVLLAMLVIQALGIQQGMGVFVAALAFVGWGEVAQFVREQVRTIQPQLYIEAARSTGASPVRILQHEVLPNLLPALVVLGALEMGAVLLLLAELGFLNIFLGGGFKVEFQIDKITYFSDIPEWGALLANIRDWWRSYPWMAWYPSLAFFLSIMAFNLLGEGLRRFLEETPYNLTRLFNRYTLLILATLVAGLGWSLRATAPISVYQSQAEQFNTERALQDVRALAGPELQGRESGTGGATAAALYIARQMELAGLFPAGEKDSYLQRLSCQLPHLADVPGLEVNDGAGDQWRRLVYRQDFVEVVRAGAPAYSDIQGRLVGIAFGPHPGTTATDPYSMRQLELKDKVILAVGIQDLLSYRLQAAGGVLIVQDDVSYFERKYLFPEDTLRGRYIPTPVMAITPQVAEALLQGSGTSLETLRARAATLSAGQFEMTQPGQLVKMHLKAILHDDPPDTCINVIGFIPGVGAEVEYQGRKLNNNAIVVSAYYDGLGVGPEGTLYPGANDNASGVAAMLEMARLLKNSPYQPKKTVIFAAWSGGERGSGVSLFNLMNARTGFNNLTIEAVLELSGAGGGTNAEIDLAPGSSYRLVQLYQQATAQLGYKITTRGRNPHFGLSIAPGFGGRTGLTAYLSCNGSDQIAHKARDGYEAIQPKRFEMLGRTSLLGVLILSREVNY